MNFKTNVKIKTKKLLGFISWLLFAILLCGIALTIIFRKNDLLWLFILGDLLLVGLFFIPFAWYGNIIHYERIKKYLSLQSTFTIVDEFLQMHIDNTLSSLIQEQSFYWGCDVKNNEPEFGFWKIVGKTQLFVDLDKNKFRYFVGNKKTEEQDMLEEDFINKTYEEIKLNCTAKDFLDFIASIDINVITEK